VGLKTFGERDVKRDCKFAWSDSDSSCLSVRLSTLTNSVPAEPVFLRCHKFGLAKIGQHYLAVVLNEDLCTFMVVTPWISSGAGRISDYCYGEIKNRRFISNTFFQKTVRLTR